MDYYQPTRRLFHLTVDEEWEREMEKIGKSGSAWKSDAGLVAKYRKFGGQRTDTIDKEGDKPAPPPPPAKEAPAAPANEAPAAKAAPQPDDDWERKMEKVGKSGSAWKKDAALVRDYQAQGGKRTDTVKPLPTVTVKAIKVEEKPSTPEVREKLPMPEPPPAPPPPRQIRRTRQKLALAILTPVARQHDLAVGMGNRWSGHAKALKDAATRVAGAVASPFQKMADRMNAKQEALAKKGVKTAGEQMGRKLKSGAGLPAQFGKRRLLSSAQEWRKSRRPFELAVGMGQRWAGHAKQEEPTDDDLKKAGLTDEQVGLYRAGDTMARRIAAKTAAEKRRYVSERVPGTLDYRVVDTATGKTLQTFKESGKNDDMQNAVAANRMMADLNRADAKAPAAAAPVVSAPTSRKMAEMYAKQADKDITPGNMIPVGAENIGYRWKADAITSMLRHVEQGKTPEEAAGLARAEAREWIAKHNARRPKDTSWQRWEGSADDAIDMVSRELKREREGTAAQGAAAAETAAARVSTKGGVSMPEAASGVGRDAGNASMRAAGRTAWNEDDYNAAVKARNQTVDAVAPRRPAAERTQVASTIMNQLGGGRFRAMTGARDAVATDSGVMFKLPKMPGVKVNKVEVVLNPDDTYTLKTYRIGPRGLKVETLSEDEGLHADQIEEVFQRRTGLATRLGATRQPVGTRYWGTKLGED